MPNVQESFFLDLYVWSFILQDIFMGEAGTVNKDIDKLSMHVLDSFDDVGVIVNAGWYIYLLGYLL